MNYNTLRNKPTINYRELIGDSTVSEVGGITEEEFDTLLDTDLASYYTKAQIDELFARSYVFREKSGDIVTFDCPESTNGIAQVASDIVAVQSGSGDPSLSNIRPFSGFSAVERRRTGVNVWGGEALKDDFVRSTSNVTVNTTDKYLTFPYTATSSGLVYGHVKFKENTQYTIILTGYNTSESSRTTNLRVYYTNGTYDILQFNTTEATKQTAVIVTSSSKSVRYIAKYSGGGNTVLYYDECGVFEGNKTEQDFVPYSGATYITTLKDGQGNPLTCYGGGLMNQNGVQSLVNGWLYLTIDSVDVLNTAETSSRKYFSKTIGALGDVINGEIICDSYITTIINTSTTTVGINIINSSTYNDARINIRPSNVGSYTLNSFNAELAQNPIHVIYKLANPQQIPQDSLSIVSTGGINNIWCDSGDITVRALDKIIQG